MEKDQEKAASKAYFPRRRSGCMTCKKRRVRCDEGHPTCKNCSIGDRDCQYAQAQVPLRERRKRELKAILPGEHEPWTPECSRTPSPFVAVSQSPPPQVSPPPCSSAVDHFGALPVGLTNKARELFHFYFTYDPTSYEAASNDTNMDGVGMALNDPVALQGTLLLAGTHYTWIHGSLQSFSETYFLYKIATIQTVNKAVADPSLWKKGEYSRLIATLGLVECYAGNREATETHLAGLATLQDARRAKDRPCPGGGRSDADDDEELTDRCVILLVIFIAAINSRVELFKNDLPMAETVNLMRQWKSSLPARLSALRLLPSFFLPPPTSLWRPVDVSGILAAIHIVTADCDECLSPRDFEQVWRKGTPHHLLLRMINAHTSPPVHGGTPIFSSLSGMLAAVALYFSSILGVAGVGWKSFTDLCPYMVGVLMRDLKNSRQTCGDLWLWKAFIAGSVIGSTQSSEALLLYEWIQEWSEISGIRDWEGVREVLGRVAWPEADDEGRFECLWGDMMISPEVEDEEAFESLWKDVALVLR